MADILSLSTERKRRTVGIDGKAYEMLDRDEMPLADALGLSSIAKECEKAKSVQDPDQVAALCKRLKACARMILPSLPVEIEDKLTDTQRLNLLTAFCSGPAKPEAESPAAPATETPS